MGRMGGQQPGQQGGMNPLMMMTLMGDDSKTKKSCDEDYNVKKFVQAGDQALEATTDIAAIRSGIIALSTTDKKADKQTKYATCLSDAPEEGKEKSTMDKLLPLMMMGMGGQ